jgi:hypothetical protein
VTELEAVLRWISGNEALLSGIAALAAIVGLILSPIGMVLRRRAMRRQEPPAAGPSVELRIEDPTQSDAAQTQRADAVPYDFRAECARVRDVAVESFGF